MLSVHAHTHFEQNRLKHARKVKANVAGKSSSDSQGNDNVETASTTSEGTKSLLTDDLQNLQAGQVHEVLS